MNMSNYEMTNRKPPYLVTTRDQIRSVARRWRSQYGKDHPMRVILARLEELDLEVATREDVKAVMNKVSMDDTWTMLKCDLCGREVDAVVVVGQSSDVDSRTAELCSDCARALSNLFDALPSTSVSDEDQDRQRPAATGEDERPEWSASQNSKSVWTEDEATCGDPDHETIKAAWRRSFGEDYPDVCLASWDAGDAVFRLFPKGRVAVCSFPGNSEIRVIDVLARARSLARQVYCTCNTQKRYEQVAREVIDVLLEDDDFMTSYADSVPVSERIFNCPVHPRRRVGS